jgi:hypothetical protein
VLALGLFLGRERPGASEHKRAMSAANVLHNQFKELFSSTCCRVLTRNVKHDPRQHFRQCAEFTAQAAQLAAVIILEGRPELAVNADIAYLSTRDSWLGSKLRQLLDLAWG